MIKVKKTTKKLDSITNLQEEYAKHCGCKTFEELKEKNEEALKIWYLNMLK